MATLRAATRGCSCLEGILLFLVRGMLFAAWFLATVCEGKEIDRDWSTSPAIVQIDTNEDIYAVGDAHGDFKRLVKVLAGAGIIRGKPKDPEDLKWAARKAVVVFTGDMIDKGKRSLDVIALVRTLQVAARAQGGQVVVLMGNHEA